MHSLRVHGHVESGVANTGWMDGRETYDVDDAPPAELKEAEGAAEESAEVMFVANTPSKPMINNRT